MFEGDLQLFTFVCVLFVPGLFRCTIENICLHASEVCNGIVHCQQSYEDEASCTVTCPEFCLCNNTVALCENVLLLNGNAPDTSILGIKLFFQDSVISWVQLDLFYHLHFVDFSACGIHQLKVQQTSATDIAITFFDLSKNNVEDILPLFFKKWVNLTFLLLQNNDVKRLRSFSLTGIKKLQVINMSKNVISTIDKHSFNDIASVHVLDLSFNMLNKIVKHSIDEIDTIAILIFVGNEFENVQVVTFIHHVKIDNKGFCCTIETKYCSSDSKGDPPVQGFMSGNISSFRTSQNNYSLTSRTKFYDNTQCRYLIKSSTVRYLFWATLALCIPVNTLFLFVKIVPNSKSELRIFNFCIFFFDVLKCSFILGLLMSDIKYTITFSFSYLQWRKSLLCLCLGNVYFVSKQMILHTMLGHVLFDFYVVTSICVLKPGEMSRKVFTFQLFGSVFWISISLAAQVLTHPDSDLCLSLTSVVSSDTFVKPFIILNFILNAVVYCIGILFLIKIFFKVVEVEKISKKKREKNWILKLFFVILVNFLCGFVTDAFSLSIIFNQDVASYEILLVAALFPVLIHPLLLM